MPCPTAMRILQAYIDDDLSSDEAVRLEQHLATCTRCRDELRRVRAVVEALETWPLVFEPERLTARVMAQVKPHPQIPRFRLRWSDLAISVAGTWVTSAVLLAWYTPSAIGINRLFSPEMRLQLRAAQLEILLFTQRLPRMGTELWLLLIVGIAMVTTALIVAWSQRIPHIVTRRPGPAPR